MELTYMCPPAIQCYDVVDVLQILFPANSNQKPVPPSQFMAEMKLSTEERLEKFKCPFRKIKGILEANSENFLITPSIVVFQNFIPGVVCSTQLSLCNSQKISRPLRPLFKESPYFSVSYASEDISTHIAPGMSLIFNIKFSAEDVKDYRYQIAFTTEGEEFVVPIIAICPRPLLDFPDHINLPTCAVKVGSEYTFLVRNSGQASAIFTLIANAPFSINPNKGVLLPKQTMQLTIYLKPQKTGQVEDHLIVKYETGEKFSIKLQGCATNSKITLEKGSLQFRKTFVGLTRSRNIKLTNNSKHIVQFQWKLYSSQLEDDLQAEKIKNSLKFIKEHESIKSNTLETFNIIDDDGHAKIYDRILEDEIQQFDSQNQFLYENSYFKIIPLTGDVWPGGSFDFTVVFLPADAILYHNKAYLEITGCEERIKLNLNGEGVGPHIEFNLHYLNANKMFMCAVHQYEIAVINKGDIPGDIVYQPKKTEFGGKILCWPLKLHLNPNQCGNFVLQFSSKTQGYFFEDICFEVTPSGEIKTFVLMGEIICPLLKFEIVDINLGTVPIGYPVRLPVVLRNPSMVPIEFVVYVKNDGDIPATTCKEYAILPFKCGMSCTPKEFDYCPRTGVVPANSSITVEVTLIANIIRKCVTTFIAQLWGSDRYSVSLPVKFNACVPRITCIPPEVNIRFCFVTYRYNRTITLRNESELPGFFQLNSEMQSEQNGITCSVSVTEGFIKPYGEVEIELVIMTTFLGEDRMPFYIKLFGGYTMQCCTIICNGQGPVVTVQPDKMNFGNVTLLEFTSRQLIVCNDSPITASVKTGISPRAIFVIEPRVLEIPPEESVEITVSVYLTNPYTYRDKLQISVENGNDITCLLSAKGIGTSILCEPKICPVLDVGISLTHQKFSLQVKLTNKGFRPHKILWSRQKRVKQIKENTDTCPSVFSVVPSVFDLVYEDSIIINIEGFTAKARHVEEDFYCHAVIEKSKTPTVIMSFIAVGRFVEPSVEVSKKEMRFCQIVGAEDTSEFLTDIVDITNTSDLPIEIDIYLNEPFYLIVEGVRLSFYNVHMEDKETVTITVAFGPETENKRCFIAYEHLNLDYRNHPKIDKIKLVGEVSYPNVTITPNSLNFACLPSNAVDYREIMLKNISPLPVTYYFEWQEATFVFEELETSGVIVPTHFIDSDFTRESSDSGVYLKELEMKSRITEEQTLYDNDCIKHDSKETLMNVDELDVDTSLQDIGKSLPIQYYPQRLYLEKYQSYHYVQIQDVIPSPLYMDDVLTVLKENEEYLAAIRSLLYNVVADYDEPEYNIDIIKGLLKKQHIRNRIDSELDIMPSCGFLRPYECQYITVSFHPSSNVCVETDVLCHVIGGASELLSITGISSDLSFLISNTFVDFGRQVFCDRCEKTIILTNTGQASFEFSTSAEEFPGLISSDLLIEVGCLTVTPKFGVLPPESCVTLLIQYFPGIAGEFNEVFEIKIGYLAPVIITVHGYGVFPQTFLYLPRPSFFMLSPYVTYLAIASLTPDYLKSLSSVKNIMHYNSKNVYEEDIPKVIRETLKKDDWVIISYNDFYPSIMDIDLAIERIILYQHIYNSPAVLLDHIKMHKAVIIPDFTIPTYLADFDYVVLNTTVCYTIIIFNYGPVNADVKVVAAGCKKTNLESAGLELQFCRSKIRVGDTKELFIIFHPTVDIYLELDCEVNFPFYLDVGHGPRIPVTIKGIVTVPAVTPKLHTLIFGEVHCGDCMKRSLILNNKGHVTSEWYAVIEKRTKKKASKQRLGKHKRKPVMFLKKSSGVLQPGGGCLLDVFFEPLTDGIVELSLIIFVNQNPEEVVISLRGVGVKPLLKITEEVIQFEPVLPYVNKCEKFFTIENMSSFPVEFYLADFDYEIDEEEKILDMLMKYYKLNELYIPQRSAGKKLPSQLIGFYHKILDKLREKLIRVERERIIEEKQLFASKESLIKPDSSRRSSISKRSGVSARSKPPVHYAAENVEFLDPLSAKGPQEIGMLVGEHMDELVKDIFMTDNDKEAVDPVNAAILASKIPVMKDPTDLREGVFIIFHGAPFTNLRQTANKAGLAVNLPVYSIDRLFIESLAANNTSAASKVNQVITEEFSSVASELDLVKEEGSDEFDEVQKKINVLLSGKPKKPKTKTKGDKKGSAKSGSKKSSEKESKGSKKAAKKKKGIADESDEVQKKTNVGKPQKSKTKIKGDKKGSAKSDSKKSSEKGSKGSKKTAKKKRGGGPIFLEIPEILLAEILQQRLSLFTTGVVIESLHSIFIKEPLIVLNNLLSAIGNAKYIHCIILSVTFQESVIADENSKVIKGNKITEERKALLHKIIEMGSDEFSKLSPEEVAVFKEYVLKQRKQNTLNKREALRKRLLEPKLPKGKVKTPPHRDDKKQKTESKDSGKNKSGGNKGDSKLGTTKSSTSKKSRASKSPKGSTKKETRKGDSKPGTTKSSTSKKSKTSKSSKVSSKKGKGKVKLSSEAEQIKRQYETFKNGLQNMLHIFEYWDRKSCKLLKPFLVAKATTSKAKGNAKKASTRDSKEGSESVMKATKTATSNTTNYPTPDEKLKLIQTGISCWLLCKAHQNRPIETMVENLLLHTSDLSTAISALEYSCKDKFEEVVEFYTVLRKPKEERIKNISDIFFLKNAEIVPVLSSDIFELTREGIAENGLKLGCLFPNICISLRIFCTLLVTVAQAERSFSRLAHIKNDLRLTMTQSRLSDLGTLTTECDLASQTNFDSMIDDFASRKEISRENSIDRKSTSTNISPKPKRRKSSIKISKQSVPSTLRSLSSTKQNNLSPEVEHVEDTLTPRAVLNPGEMRRYSVRFQPEICGGYVHTFTVEVVGWPVKFFLTCQGKCDIPRVDMNPECLFTKVAMRRNRKNMYCNNVFLKESNVFDFGSALIRNPNCSEQLGMEADFAFTNISLLFCKMTFCLGDGALNAYEYKPDVLLIEPDVTQALTVIAKPVTPESCENQLIIAIKDNPKIETINLKSEAYKFEYDVTANSLRFDRILINRSVTKSFSLNNQSPVAVNWAFVEPENILQYFAVSQLSGYIQPKSSCEIVFEYSSATAQEVPKQKLEIEIFDKDFKCQTPLCTNSIEISAEAIEIPIECLKEIQLGEVKGKFLHTISYNVTIKGKYAAEFAFTDIEPDQDSQYREHQHIRNYFKITPAYGILQPNKPLAAKLTFFAKRVVDFKNVPIFNCTFTESLFKSEIEKFPLLASGTTFISGFELCPPDIVNFGPQLIGTEKILEMTLKNEGKFEFSYSVVSLKKLNEEKEKKKKKDKVVGKKTSKSSKTKKSKKKGSTTDKKCKSKSSKTETSGKKASTTDKRSKSKSSKTGTSKKTSTSGKRSKSKSSKNSKETNKKNKPKPTKLDAGIFSIVSSTGKVNPNETVTIEISSKPKVVAVYEEVIVFFISECKAADRNGRFITLSANGSVPDINFNDYNAIFREQYIVKNITEFDCPAEAAMGTYCVFIKEEERLHFNQVIINKEATARIRLENVGPIPADLVARVSTLSPEDTDVFSIKTKKFSVDSYSANYAIISFIPNSINMFTGTLHISCQSPMGSTGNGFHIKLSGESLVPEVAIRYPEVNKRNLYTINFCPTFFGNTSLEKIKFENVGIISCQVIIEVCGEAGETFTLIPQNNTIPFLRVQEEVIKATAHTNLINLCPQQLGEFALLFTPTIEGQFKCTLKLHVVDNPFETFMIFVTASCYKEDVIIDGLPTFAVSDTGSVESQFFMNPGYELNFGYTFINSLQKKCFKIINNSSTAIYKFEFAVSDKLLFIPAVGHLKPNARKEIIATFLSKEPMNISREPIECTIYQIQYLNPQLETLSWDERQNLIIWEPIHTVLSRSPQVSLSAVGGDKNQEISTAEAAIKTITEKCEPPIEITPGTSKCVPLLITVMCDYTCFECNTEHIEMTDTLAFEKKSQTFEVINTSNVFLNLFWKISMDESYPQRINSATHQNSNLNFIKKESLQSNRLSKSGTQLFNVEALYNKSSRPHHLIGTEKFVDDLSLRSSSESSLFSVEANLSDRSNDSWMEGDFLPFTIIPNVASIPPKETQTFTITFMPKDVFDYLVHLRSEILNLHPLLKPLHVTVKVRSLLPLCHFELAPSEYLNLRKSCKKFCGDITDENTKIVEFEAIGLGTNNLKTFNIINPTGESFSYKWIPAKIDGNDVSLFHCHKPEGLVEKGRMDDAIFSFLPQAIGTFEAFYIFRIEKYGINRTFLLVGKAREPNIYFSNPHLQIKPTIIGVDATECISLKNSENLEVDFRFQKESFYSEGRLQALAVAPVKGILQPYGESQIKVTFHPAKRGEVNFNLKCVVEKIRKPLPLSVTANCFAVESKISYEADGGNKVILDPENVNVLEMKSMVPHFRQQITFTISNTGESGFYYSWTIKKDLISSKIKINFKEAEGYVANKDETSCKMSITPLAKVVVKKLKITLQIRYGPSYRIDLVGSATQAVFTFAPEVYNFGPCLVQKEPTSYYQKTVEFTNNDVAPVTLECKIDQDQTYLTTDFKSKQIGPKKTEPLRFTFSPQELQTYFMEVQFFVNSVSYNLKFYGEGVLNLIELNHPYDKFIDLGSILIGDTITKQIRVINKGTAPVDIIFDLYDRLPYFSKPKKVLKPEFEREEKSSAVKKVDTKIERKDKKGTKTSKKGGKKKNEIKKSKGSKKSKDSKKGVGDKKGKEKKEKSKESKESKGSKKSAGDKKGKGKKEKSKDSKKSKGCKKSKGSKKGKEKKEKESSPTIVKQTPSEIQALKTQALIHSSVTFSPKQFTTVRPQQSTVFEIKFSPTERMPPFTEKISYQVQDIIETLCIFKACGIAPVFELDKDCITFGSITKGCSNTQKIILYNKGDVGSKFKWIFEKAQPNFDITPKEAYISPDTTVTFIVTFKPDHVSCLLQTKAKCHIEDFKTPLQLTLTGSCFEVPPPKELIKFQCPVRESDKKIITIQNPTGAPWTLTPTITGQYFSTAEFITINPRSSFSCEITYKSLTMSHEIPHEASIFFNPPDGQGFMYNLIGCALDPKPVDIISRNITCKTNYHETLTVQNWLKCSQKFSVLTESKSAAPLNRSLYKLTGNDTIEVFAQNQRDYTWSIYVLTEGVLKFKVIFKNMTTKEYLFYEVNLTVTRCPPLDVIKLVTCIRVPVSHILKLQNPIKTPVVFNVQCSSSEVSFENAITVSPYSEYALKLTYNPLLLGESEAELNITSSDLGIYPYQILLTAHPPVPEPYVCFTANLGQIASQKAFITNTTHDSLQFIPKCDHPDIFSITEIIIIAEPRQKVGFEIFFEPSKLGNIQSTLTLISPISGAYIYPLIGTCNLPKPQGPYFIKPGGNTTITFKNPFEELKTFKFAIEPAIFHIKNNFEVIKPRKDIKVTPGLVPLKNLEILLDHKYPITGKLIIFCAEPKFAHIKWVYYLQGDLSD